MTDRIHIDAVQDGIVHPLDSRERMFAWFRRPPAPADYLVSYQSSTYEFDGVDFRQPVSPSDLVAKALARIPGNAPRLMRHEWSLYDDFTRGQCGWLALSLAERLRGRLMTCGRLTNASDAALKGGAEWPTLEPRHMAGFLHAGVLVGDHVYCALGRSDPTEWSHYVARSHSESLCGLVAQATLAPELPMLTQKVADSIPAVVELIAMLVGDVKEPRHPDPWAQFIAGTCEDITAAAPLHAQRQDGCTA